LSKSIKGTETEQNLLAAFAGESQARNRYTFFTSIARKEGYEQIANIFTETAGNEKEHAEVFFKYLEGGDIEIKAAYPAGIIGDTRANLESAANGEKLEWSEIYANFESRYRKLAKNIDSGEVFKKKSTVKWHCSNCGYIHEGTEAPKECPACKHAQSYYELLAENY
jgi:rubrerythrin